MENTKRCKVCILPVSIPSVKLDEHGVCNHCNRYYRLFGNWENIKLKKEKELADLLQRAKRLNRAYDCLVPLSGGKDSTYALYLCNKIYNMQCLCVTFDNGFLSEYAKENIKNALAATGADHVFYSINRDTLLSLYSLFLEKCGQFCPVCMTGIGLSMETAVRAFKIPLVISGTGTRVAYNYIIREKIQGGNAPFFRNVVKGGPLEKSLESIRLIDRSPWNIQRLIKITYTLLRIPNRIPISLAPQNINLYDYIDASYNEIIYTLEEEMGWTKPTDQFEHIDCLLHELPFYMHTLNFPELTTSTLHHSGLIRVGLMTREEAMEIEERKQKKPQIPKALDSFLTEIEMSRSEFESYVRDWRSIEKFRDRKKDIVGSMYQRITGR